MGAVIAGHNVIACEVNPVQLNLGIARLETEVQRRLEMRAFTRLKLPWKYVAVHAADVGKDVGEARLLPKLVCVDPRLASDDDQLKGVKRQCLALKVCKKILQHFDQKNEIDGHIWPSSGILHVFYFDFNFYAGVGERELRHSVFVALQG